MPMKNLIAVVLVFFIILVIGSPAFAGTDFFQEEDVHLEDPSIVVNRPVNVQGLTGLLFTNSAYTQPKGRMVIGLSGLAENSSMPEYSILQGIATITGGITDRIEIGAKMQVIATNPGSAATREIGAGDADLLFKWKILSTGETLPAIAFGLAYTLPTGDKSKGFNECKQEGVRFMMIGSTEREMPGDSFFGIYFEGQIVAIDKVHRPSTSPYTDIYGVVNAGVLFPLTDDRRLQAIVEYNKVAKKKDVALYDQNSSAVMPGLRYVTPNLNISLGVQLVMPDQTGAENTRRYVGTLSYAF